MKLIQCTSWKESKSADGGACVGGPHDGKTVSFGTCMMACSKYDGPVRDQHLFRAFKGVPEGASLQTIELQSKRKKGKCKGCKERAPVVEWLRLRWIGVPWLKRWRWDTNLYWLQYQPSPGCGCLLKPKRLVEALQMWWRI